MRRRLFILGTGGCARETAFVAEQLNAREQKWDICGFISRDSKEVGKDLGLAKVVGDEDWLLSQNFEADLVVGLGFPAIRQRAIDPFLLRGDQFQFPNFIHPNVIMDFRRVELGHGNVIFAGCVLTCDIVIGNFNFLSANTVITHDCRIGNFNVLNPSVNVSGNVTIFDNVLVGTGSQILQGLSVHSGAVVGAGAVVTRSVLSNVTVIGVPAKPMQSSHDEV